MTLKPMFVDQTVTPIPMSLKIQRLELLARMLQDVAEGTWRVTHTLGDSIGQAAEFSLRPQDPNSAHGWFSAASQESGFRFACCPIGHACLDERFPELMLTRAGPHHYNDTMTNGPRYGWVAVQNFFGLSEDDAMRLFHPEHYDEPTLEAVQMRLNFLIFRLREVPKGVPNGHAHPAGVLPTTHQPRFDVGFRMATIGAINVMTVQV